MVFAGDFYVQVGPGIEVLGQNFNTHNDAYNIGGEIALGYAFDKQWSVWLTGNYCEYPGDDSPLSVDYRTPDQFYESSLAIRYTIDAGVLSPYVFTGLGLFGEYSGASQAIYNAAFNLYPQNISFELEEGLGVQIPVDKGLKFFVESKINIIFQSFQLYQYPANTWSTVLNSTALDYPIDFGVVLKI